MGVELHNLQPHEGATRERKRVGRGIAAGQGKTAGKGHKGQKSRSGDRTVPWFFEGGQTPLHMRIPKRGFRPVNKVEYSVVNVGKLNELFNENEEVTPEVLLQRGLVRKNTPVKILGDGEITKPLVVKAHKFSKSAKEKIEAAGGKAIEI